MKTNIRVAACFLVIVLLASSYRRAYIESIIGTYPNAMDITYSFPLNGERHLIQSFATLDDVDSIKKFYKSQLWYEGGWDLEGELATSLIFFRFVEDSPGNSPMSGYTYYLTIQIIEDNNIKRVEIYYRYGYEHFGDM